MSTAEDTLKSRCHPSCRTCTGECLLLQMLNLNGLGLAELKTASGDPLIPFSCTACGLCAVVCSRRLDAGALMRAWRGEVAASDGVPAALTPRLTDQPETVYARYRRIYGSDTPDQAPAETVFFPGCALSVYTPDLALAVFDHLHRRFPGAGWLDSCCFDLLETLGLDERYAQAQQSLAEEVARYGVRRIVTACPTCHHRLVQSFPELQVVSIYQLLADERRKISGLPTRIAIHDSCPDRLRQELGQSVRLLLPQVEKLKHEGKRSLCCGAGGGVSLSNPEMAQAMAQRHWAEIEASGAQLLVTYCTSCAIQLAQTSPGIPVAHVLDLVFGLPHDYAQIASRIVAINTSTRDIPPA